MMRKKLLIATTNPGKVKEMQACLSDLPVELLSLSDVGIDQDVDETGKTYQENSQLKATFYAKLSGLPAVADDGGLEIAALNGEPGIRSRRWLGHHGTDEELRAHLQKVSLTLPDNNRNAAFRTVVTLALPTGEVFSTEGLIAGIIAKEPKSKFVGYPFRAFFYLPDLQKYYSADELTEGEMKAYNHRYKAIKKLKKIIQEQLGLRK